MPDPQGGSTHKKSRYNFNAETTDNALAAFIIRPQFAIKSAYSYFKKYITDCTIVFYVSLIIIRLYKSFIEIGSIKVKVPIALSNSFKITFIWNSHTIMVHNVDHSLLQIFLSI